MCENQILDVESIRKALSGTAVQNRTGKRSQKITNPLYFKLQL